MYRYSSGAGQSVHYTSRGGGACRYQDESDLARLYAPPSYEELMAPGRKELLDDKHEPRHCGPPPAYSAAMAGERSAGLHIENKNKQQQENLTL